MAHGVRCGPLCQHPGCWQSSEPLKNLHSAKDNMRYVSDIILKHSKHAQQGKCKSNEASESALTVQSLEYALPVKGTTAKHRERMTVPIGNGSSMQIFTASHTLPKASFSEMILTEDSGESGGPGDYVITPVLVWRPGTKQCQRGKQGASKPDTVKVMNLADQVHLEEPEHLKSSSSVKAKVLRRRSRTARSSDDSDNYSYLQDIPPHIIQQLLEHLRSASRVSLNNMEQGCGILPTTPCFHPPTLPSRPHKSVIAHATTHQPTALPPLTPQPHHPSPRPVDTVQSPLIPDHAVGQPTPPPASVMYDLLTQMLWTLGAYPSSSSGYSRVLAQRPHEVLRGRGRPRRCPAPSGIVATTTLTVPQRAAVHQSGSNGAPSPASCCPAQLRYPYGNPVLPRLPSRQYPPNGESGSLSMEPMGYKGQRLNADDLLHVSSYPSTPREPRVVDLALGGAGAGLSSVPGALDNTIRIPGCPDRGPLNSSLGPCSAVPGAKSDGVPVGGIVFSPDHMVVGAQLDSGQLLLLGQHGEVAYRVPNSPDVGVTLPDIKHTLAPITSDNQQTLSITDARVTLVVPITSDNQQTLSITDARVTLPDIKQTLVPITSDNQQTLSITDVGVTLPDIKQTLVPITSDNQQTCVATNNNHPLDSPITLALT